jgi:LytS/YehU family sensor histidine kinase
MVVVARVRRLGIALGSLVAAFFAVGIVSGMVLPLLGVPTGRLDPPWVAILSVLTIVLGGFIYRDILRRDERVRALRADMRWLRDD